MKPLTNTDKAKLLHELFPEEMPMLLDDMKTFCTDFIRFQDDHRKNWSGIMHFDLWLYFAEEIAGLIRKHRIPMLKSSRVFSEQLCFSYAVLLVNDRIIKYAEKNSRNLKFRLAIELLYK